MTRRQEDLMKKLLWILTFWIEIPFAASTAGIYWIFRRKIPMAAGAAINGILFLILLMGVTGGSVERVAEYSRENGALEYSFRYFVEELQQEQNVRLLSIDGIAPTLENIENGTCPLTVSLCLITRADDPNPYVQKMKKFILSPDGQQLVFQTGYAPLKGRIN